MANLPHVPLRHCHTCHAVMGDLTFVLHSVTGYAQCTRCSLSSNYDILIIGFDADRVVQDNSLQGHCVSQNTCIAVCFPELPTASRHTQGASMRALQCQHHATSGQLQEALPSNKLQVSKTMTCDSAGSSDCQRLPTAATQHLTSKTYPCTAGTGRAASQPTL